MGAELSVGHSSIRPAIGRPGRLWGDERLAREVATGNERAFAMLFDRYHQQLYRYCRSLTRNEQDAEDALQATLIKALVALREDHRNAPVRPWLYRIAHNESISLLRSRPLTVELAVDQEAPQGVADSVEQRERLALLLADLQELPERQRGALVMREMNGLSHEEIALALEVSPGAAKQTILEARRSLLEFTEGRAMPCEDIQRVISDQDRRSLRSRRVRAHLRGCTRCSAFAAAIPQRHADLQALCPLLPAAGAASLLARLTGAGSGHGGGGAGLLTGSAAKGIGAAVSIKAAATGVAVLATVTVGAVTVLHRTPPAHRPVTPSGVVTPSSVVTPTVTRAAGTASHGAGARARTSRGTSAVSAPGHRPGRSTRHAAVRLTPAAAHGHAHSTHGPVAGLSPAVGSSAGAPGHGGTGAASGHARPLTPGHVSVTPGSVSGRTHSAAHHHTPTLHTRSTVQRATRPDHRKVAHHRLTVRRHPHRVHWPKPLSSSPARGGAGVSSTSVDSGTTTATTTTATTTTVTTTTVTTTTSAGGPGGGGMGGAGASKSSASVSGTNGSANNSASSS